MSAVIPTPRHALPPFSEIIGPDGRATVAQPEFSTEIVPRVVPDVSDALLSIFLAFPETTILESGS